MQPVVYTGGVHGPYTADYMAHTCTRPVHGHVSAVYTSCARRVDGGHVHGHGRAVYMTQPCKRTGRVGGCIHSPCIQPPTWPVRLHGPYMAMYTAV